MEKVIEEMPVKTLTTVKEEILQGMIASFRLEGIKIQEKTAYTILEQVDRKLKMQKK
ncbi:hypothetical protein [uncultured Sanguibacteroides sp.]|uniref:hypothetical protein n=1 Tax=uncultured Sanguibacteroides sp. TaxID=1635151 RepID=UPI0025D7DFCE|nr:hypothetical protein [uncultured Sanguibacteroides sp.]